MNSPQFLPALADALLWILRGSGRAAVAVAAVLIVRAIFRRRLPARWRYALWLAVPIAWLLPQLPRTPIAVTRYADPQVVRFVMAFDSVADAAPARPDAIAAPGGPAASPRLGWHEIGGLIWASGAAVLAAFWITAHRRVLRKFRRQAHIPDSSILELLQECSDAMGLKSRPEVVESPTIPSPAVTGLFRPMLLLPSALAERFSREELRLMLLHELAHIRRGDLITNTAAVAMLAVHWFNPILWFAAARMRADRESACDATVLAITATDQRAAYGDTLLRFQAELSGTSSYPAFVGIQENTRRLRDRILRIGAFRRGGAAWGVAALVAAAGLFACFGLEPLSPAASGAKAASEPPPSLDQRLRRLATKGQQVQVSSTIRQLTEKDLAPLVPEISRLSLDGRQLGVFHLAAVKSPSGVAALVAKLPPPRLSGENALFSIADGADPKPGLTTRTGQRAVIEIIREFRYPIVWKDPNPDPAFLQGPPTPTSFETRNLGITLDVLPTIPALQEPIETTPIDFEISPQLVFFTGWAPAKTAAGLPIRKPKFSETKIVPTSGTMLNGQTLVFLGDLEIPDQNPWGLKDINSIKNDVPTHRASILWLITMQLVNSKSEPGFSGTVLAPELFEPRDWQFTNMPIEQCVAHFTGVSRLIDPNRRGLNIVLGKPAREVRNVTINLRRTNLITALELSAKAAGFRVEEGGDNTLILTP